MASLTNKKLEFLSNEKLINILRDVLEEIDVVANCGAHRSTTYLAVSAIEGLLGELFNLLGINSSTAPSGSWPFADKKSGKFKKVDDLTGD